MRIRLVEKILTVVRVEGGEALFEHVGREMVYDDVSPGQCFGLCTFGYSSPSRSRLVVSSDDADALWQTLAVDGGVCVGCRWRKRANLRHFLVYFMSMLTVVAWGDDARRLSALFINLACCELLAGRGLCT